MDANSGDIAAIPAYAASTCSHTSCSRAISATARTGSIDVVDVVPTVATIATRAHSVGTRRLDAGAQRVRAHAKLVVAGDAHDVVASDAERDRRLLDVRVRLVRDVDAQRRQVAPGHAELADPEPERLARGGERGEARDRRGVVDDADPRRPERPAARRASASSTSSSSVAAGDVRQSIAFTSSVAANASASHGHRRRAGREIREEPRMVPVRRARHDDPLEIVEDALERFALLGSVLGQRGHARRRGAPAASRGSARDARSTAAIQRGDAIEIASRIVAGPVVHAMESWRPVRRRPSS